MNERRVELDRLIWATRGRFWGFRFLLDGGLRDPLAEYERVFADAGDEPTVWHHTELKAALRFPDPDGRRDAAGRVIPHEFVVPDDLARLMPSADEAQRTIWEAVARAYDRIWEVNRPPAAVDLRFDDPDDQRSRG